MNSSIALPLHSFWDTLTLIHLHTDASGFAISGVVSQLHSHSVTFYSCKCTLESAITISMTENCSLLSISAITSKDYATRFKVLSMQENLSFKALNRRQAHWAELLVNYDFVLIPISSTKNPADGPSRHSDYVQDISGPTSLLVPSNACRLLILDPTNPTTFNISNALFASIVGVHAVDTLEPGLRERISHRRCC